MRLSRLLLGVWLSAGGLPAGALAATLEGRIIHPQRPAAAAGIGVLIVGVDSAGEAVERSLETDRAGRFVVSDLPRPGAYLVTAAYDGIGFPGGSVIFREADPEETKQITFHIYDRTSAAEHVELEKIRLVIEYEGGRYRATQTAIIRNSRLFVVQREPGEKPVLRVGLLSGHGPPRGPLGDDVVGGTVAGDVLELRGPVYPGRSELRVSYEVGGRGHELAAELAVPETLRELEIFIRDFGIEVESGRLHPMKPGRDGDMIYQRYAGFDLPPGTELPLRIRALEPESTPPAWLRGGISSLLVAGLLLFVLRPGGSDGDTEPAGTSPEQETPAHTALQAALHDLEHDFETGKLSPEDRDQLRRDLKRDALSDLQETPAVHEPADSADPAACSCGRRPQVGDRFCSACGRAL